MGSFQTTVILNSFYIFCRFFDSAVKPNVDFDIILEDMNFLHIS